MRREEKTHQVASLSLLLQPARDLIFVHQGIGQMTKVHLLDDERAQVYNEKVIRNL